MLVIFWIRKYFQHPVVTMGPTTIFGRTGLCAVNAFWILLAFFPEENALEHDFMLPVITKVVFVISSGADIMKVVGNGNFPTGMNLGITFEAVIIRNYVLYSRFLTN